MPPEPEILLPYVPHPARTFAPRPSRKQVAVALGLFLTTVATTLLAGSIQTLEAGDFAAGAESFWDVYAVAIRHIDRGLPYATALLSILLVHEFGHYFTARKHRIGTTLPLFIPSPVGTGTFGAIIMMRGVLPDRRGIFDVGVSGPLAGFVVAVGVYAYGLSLSRVTSLSDIHGGFALGDSIVTWAINSLVHPHLPANADVVLHPVAFAGWIGLFITSLNLIPVGQLDGGHLLYSLFPRMYPILARGFWGVLVVLGIAGWGGWLFWAVILVMMGVAVHPRPLRPEIPLGRGRQLLGLLTLALFLATVVPTPFQPIGAP